MNKEKTAAQVRGRLSIRKIGAETLDELRLRADANTRSLEAEAKHALKAYLEQDHRTGSKIVNVQIITHDPASFVQSLSYEVGSVVFEIASDYRVTLIVEKLTSAQANIQDAV